MPTPDAVRKARGAFYTPAYIVDHLVRETVGRLLDAKTPRQAAGLRVLDPACGEGVFLIGAYRYLLDWHRDRYVADDPEKHARGRAPRLYRGAAGEWRLTSGEKKRILLANVYGVDIDPQAVEVTRLSLFLEVLEGESKETVNNQLRFFHQRALPDLGGNIKCGNSLIGPAFYDERQMSLLDEEERCRINVFDWSTEFSDVFRSSSGGFDAIVGNPPYGVILGEHESACLARRLGVFQAVPEVFVAFIEQADRLLRPDGKLGFIVPSAWLGGPRYRPLREFVLRRRIDSVVLLPFDVFEQAYVDTVLVTTSKARPGAGHKVCTYEFPKRQKLSRIDLASLPVGAIDQRDWSAAEDFKFVLNPGILAVLSRVRAQSPATMADVARMKRGVLFDPSLLTRRKTGDNSFPYFEGDVYRYHLNHVVDRWVEYGPKMREYPREFHWFEGPRILLRRLVNRQQRLMACFLSERVITNKNLYVVRSSSDVPERFLLGILNSRLISRLYLSQVSQAAKDDFPQVTIRDILGLPFPLAALRTPRGNAHRERMVDLVESMLALHRRLGTRRTQHDRTVTQRQIEAADRQIDRLVYELYGLTEEEIAVVEGVAFPR